MIPLIVVIVTVTAAYGQQQDFEEPDILSAHGGVFRGLEWTNEELAEVSQLHATASHHRLMQLVAQKLMSSNVDDAARRKIEKFMMLKRPPKFLEHFLSEQDRNTLLQYHADGDFHKYATLIFERLFELPKSQAVAALRYFGHHTEADALEDNECYECAVQRLSERLVR